MKKYYHVHDLVSYKLSYKCANHVWDVVIKWGYFEQKTIGSQFVRAVDSISANIAEGFGRYGKNDKIRFFRIARASVYESIDWANKARDRKIVCETDYERILNDLEQLPKAINILIKITRENLNK